LKRVSRTVQSWALHHGSDKSLTELAAMYNPCIRGWITYYSHFYKTQLRPTLKRIDASMSFGGRAASLSGCAIGPKQHETGLTGSAGPTPIPLPTGYYAMATAQHWEPWTGDGHARFWERLGRNSPGRRDNRVVAPKVHGRNGLKADTVRSSDDGVIA
jgi:Group II intron, maturase-specific domain